MTTIRTHKETNYSVIDNAPINDKSLSWGAKGILVYLLSKPDDWQIYAIDLVKHSTDGKSAVYARLKELENKGYLHREKQRDSKGHLYWVSHIYESPAKNPHIKQDQPNTDFPEPVYPNSENPDTDNRTLLNTDSPNTDSPNTESTIIISAGNLCQYFINQTGKQPRGIIDQQEWDDDCIEILKLAGSNEERGKALIDQAINTLKDVGYTYKSPASLINTIGRILTPKQKQTNDNGNGSKPKEQQLSRQVLPDGTEIVW